MGRSRDENASYRVESIVDVRGRGRKTEYLIKWMGYDHSHNTWEPVCHLEGSRDLLELFRAQRIKESIRRYQNRRNGVFESFDRESNEERKERAERKDLSAVLNKGNYMQPFLVPIPESIDDMAEGGMRGFNDEASDTELIGVFAENMSLNKRETDKKLDKQYDDKRRPDSSDMTHRKDNIISNRVPDQVVKAHLNISLDNAEKITGKHHYITLEKVTDSEKLELIKKDVARALSIRKHTLINDKFYFSLCWPDLKTDEIYRKHYFRFNELMQENPKVLLRHLKNYMNESYF